MKPNIPSRTTPSDYAEELATEIEHGPHWSQRNSLVRQEVAAAPLPPRLPRAYQVSAAPLASRSVRVAPVVPLVVISHAPPRPVVAAAPVAFYSFAEAHAAEAQPWGGNTERVDPLPFGALRPDWIQWLDRAWSRYAAHALGAIAGLIFVVGYLAYSSQRGHAIAGAASSTAVANPIVMPAEIAAADPIETAPIAEPAPVAEVPPSLRAPTVTKVNVVKRAAPAKTKRGPIRINDSTPLGDLRPSRSR